MGNAFRLGGWGMYPTLIFGLIFLAIAINYARRAERRYLTVVLSAAALAFVVGALGFVTGVINTMAHSYEEPRLALVGVGESLYNIGLAMGFLVIGGIVTVVGAWRQAQREKI